ncbi:MAG: hypothetical protein K6B14_09290 [Lachnospiraceae bacterium]|nr:hypothetical protein [Lachnospiraceae bacterium]
MKERVLSDELKKYGHVFSVKRSGALYAMVFAGMIALGRVFSLGVISQIVLCIAGLAFLPFFMINSAKNERHQRRFSDLNIYMEQFLYSFMKTGKILSSLEDVMQLFESGQMHDTLEKAREFILHTYDDVSVEEEGLKIIEEAYPNDMLHILHHFALQTENLGGEYGESVRLLLEARRMWADRVYELQQEKKKKRRDIFLSIAVSLLLCLMIYLLSANLDLDLAAMPIAQAVTVGVLIMDFFIFYRADVSLTSGYVESVHSDGEHYAKEYEKLRDETPKKPWEKLNHRVMKKYVTKEIEKEFPYWLMQLSLLMQTENVQVSLYKSYDSAPEVLKPALKELIDGLKYAPDSVEPYISFLRDYTLPEIHSAMKMLYSISEGSGGDARAQIADIIRRNQRLMDRSERMKNEDAVAGMYGLFLAPQITAGIKLCVDMLLLLAVYMGGV